MPPVPVLLLAAVPALASVLLLCRPAGAAEYQVGDGVPNGWDTGTNYAAWATSRTFAVGDVLVFQYVKSQHNVYEVMEGPYKSCDADAGGSAGVLARYDTGYDRIQLTEAKTYWFICEIPGHCTGGMRVAINVSAGPPAGAGAPPSPRAPLPPTVGGASLAGGCRRSWTLLAIAVVVLVLTNVFV